MAAWPARASPPRPWGGERWSRWSPAAERPACGVDSSSARSAAGGAGGCQRCGRRRPGAGVRQRWRSEACGCPLRRDGRWWPATSRPRSLRGSRVLARRVGGPVRQSAARGPSRRQRPAGCVMPGRIRRERCVVRAWPDDSLPMTGFCSPLESPPSVRSQVAETYLRQPQAHRLGGPATVEPANNRTKPRRSPLLPSLRHHRRTNGVYEYSHVWSHPDAFP